MKSLAAALIVLVSAATLSPALTLEPNCRLIQAVGASFLRQCGDQIYSFALQLSDLRRVAERDLHGRFNFRCTVEPMCVGQPAVTGFFFAPRNWQRGPKDEQAINAVLHEMPMNAANWSHPGGTRPQAMPQAACPLYEVHIGDMAGRAICFADENGSVVVVVAADENVGLVLTFSQRNQAGDSLRSWVADLIPRFEVERATGDAKLLKWIDEVRRPRLPRD